MTPLDKTSVRVALVLFCLGLAGCQSRKIVAPLAGGYEQVAHPVHSVLHTDEPPRISFDYRKPSGQTILIWPSLSDGNVAFKDNLALFVGDKAYVQSGDKITRPRLFAVQAPELPLDITDEILRRWAAANGKSFARALQNYNGVTPEAKADRLIVHLEFWTSDLNLESRDWPDQSDLVLSWQQVADVLQTVKTKGVPKKDLRWHTPYIGE